MTDKTAVDLSHEGVDNILAALANAGLAVHYNETDGDTFLDIWLTDFDYTTATILSWRDNGEGWLLRTWEKFGGDTNTQQPDRKWPITAGNAAEVARDVASILTTDEPAQTPTDTTPTSDQALADLRATLADPNRDRQPSGADPRKPALQSVRKASNLLADPAQVAAIRDLIVHARKVHAEHAIYSGLGDVPGQPRTPREHTWDLGHDRVGYQDGALYYERRGKTLLSGAGFDNARQVGQLLAAIGVLPQRFIGGAK